MAECVAIEVPRFVQVDSLVHEREVLFELEKTRHFTKIFDGRAGGERAEPKGGQMPDGLGQEALVPLELTEIVYRPHVTYAVTLGRERHPESRCPEPRPQFDDGGRSLHT